MSRQGIVRERTSENVKAFWDEEALQMGSTPEITIRDFCFRIQELHTLLALIPSCQRLLDIGCGTGFGTLAFARRAKYVLGMDYSSEMISWANRLKLDRSYRNNILKKLSPLWSLEPLELDSIEFEVGDLLDEALSLKPFNVIIGERVLINLPSSDLQYQALKNLRRWADKGTFLFLVEPTIQGYARTDEYRTQFDLPELEKYWHNLYLDEEHFSIWESYGWKVSQVLTFSTYTLLSKVIYPAACGEANCKFLSGANRAAMELAAVFRSKQAVDEMGEKAFLTVFQDRVIHYDPIQGEKIKKWLQERDYFLPPWKDIGNQKLIIAQA